MKFLGVPRVWNYVVKLTILKTELCALNYGFGNPERILP